MLEKVQEDRLKKLQAVRDLGFDPYGPPSAAGRENIEPVQAVLDKFVKWETAEKAQTPPSGLGGGTGEPRPEGSGLGGSRPEGSGSVTPATPLDAYAAGRLVLMRDMGKMMFAHIRDDSGAIQICLRKDQPNKPPAGLDERHWALAKLLDLGDIVSVKGQLHRTRTGEITIWAGELTLLSKSLNPMPEKWHGLSDVQARYRQRYLDLASNPESMEVFQKRGRIIGTFRRTLHGRGFAEVETPTLQSVYGGAAARPFTTHHNTLDIDLFLRISPELYLKRLLVGGMPRVYEFAKVFRNEGIDTRHNPEFTLLELYQAYADYEVMMDITEELIATAAHNGWDSDGLFEQSSDMYRQAAKLLDDHQIPEGVLRRIVELGLDGADDQVGKLLQTIDAENPEFGERLVYEDFVWRARAFQQAASLQGQGRNCLPYGKQVIDYTRPWPRWTYAELVKKHAYVDWNKNSDADVRAKAHALGLNHTNDLPVVVNDIFELVVEPELAKPSEAYDVPGADGKLVHIEVLRPTFVMDYPAELCPLTRRKADDPSVALRFECFIAGMEIANAYTELNDPAVQEENFRQQLRGEAANETMRVMDEDFVTALRQGMPPAGGLGIGIDRVIMLLTNRQSIRDVVLFPLLRPTEEK